MIVVSRTHLISLALIVLLVWRFGKKWSPTEKAICVALLSGVSYFVSSRIETFADQSADEAGLVFGIPPTTTSVAPLTLYSGTTISLLSTARQFLGISKVAGVNLTGMNDASNTNNVLDNFRVQFPDQTEFTSLQPIFYTQNMAFMHQQSGIDKCLTVDPASGVLLYNSDITTAPRYGTFKFLNATDVTDGSVVSIQDKLLIQYVGDSAAANSYVFIDTDGKIKATGTPSDAAIFTIQTCMGSKCGGPNWRFQ